MCAKCGAYYTVFFSVLYKAEDFVVDALVRGKVVKAGVLPVEEEVDVEAVLGGGGEGIENR